MQALEKNRRNCISGIYFFPDLWLSLSCLVGRAVQINIDSPSTTEERKPTPFFVIIYERGPPPPFTLLRKQGISPYTDEEEEEEQKNGKTFTPFSTATAERQKRNPHFFPSPKPLQKTVTKRGTVVQYNTVPHLALLEMYTVLRKFAKWATKQICTCPCLPSVSRKDLPTRFSFCRIRKGFSSSLSLPVRQRKPLPRSFEEVEEEEEERGRRKRTRDIAGIF